ncbi:hypothetical protein QYF48_17130, partial [Brevibacillus agri]
IQNNLTIDGFIFYATLMIGLNKKNQESSTPNHQLSRRKVYNSLIFYSFCHFQPFYRWVAAPVKSSSGKVVVSSQIFPAPLQPCNQVKANSPIVK